MGHSVAFLPQTACWSIFKNRRISIFSMGDYPWRCRIPTNSHVPCGRTTADCASADFSRENGSGRRKPPISPVRTAARMQILTRTLISPGIVTHVAGNDTGVKHRHNGCAGIGRSVKPFCVRAGLVLLILSASPAVFFCFGPRYNRPSAALRNSPSGCFASRAALEFELAPGFVDGDGRAVGQVKASQARAHRQSHLLGNMRAEHDIRRIGNIAWLRAE